MYPRQARDYMGILFSAKIPTPKKSAELTGDPLWRQARTSATFPLVAALINLLACVVIEV